MDHGDGEEMMEKTGDPRWRSQLTEKISLTVPSGNALSILVSG